MKLTPKPRAGTGLRDQTRALTTEPGFRNPNSQVVMARTGAASTLRSNQVIYRMRCSGCSREYGCNGMDIKARLCPFCQGGAAAEPLRDDSTQASLFS